MWIEPSCVKIGWGVWPLGLWRKKSGGSHRNDVSPLTQGLRYRAACDQQYSKITYLPARVGVLIDSENSEKCSIPNLFFAETANLYVLLNVSCLVNVQLLDRPAVVRFSSDRKFISVVKWYTTYSVMLAPPSLSGGVQSRVTSLSLTLLTTGRPGWPGTLIPVQIHTTLWKITNEQKLKVRSIHCLK